MAYDGDCLLLAESLSRRYPTLRFEAWFSCEGYTPDFTVAVHDGGTVICQASFETTYRATVPAGSDQPSSFHVISFYERTPDRDRAATIFLQNALDVFVRQPETVAGWRKSEDDAACTVFLMPDADEAGHLVLVLDMLEGTGTLLRDVDGYGGYRSAEPLLLDRLRGRVPELAAEIDRLMAGTAVKRQEYLEWLAQRCETLDDEEIPF